MEETSRRTRTSERNGGAEDAMHKRSNAEGSSDQLLRTLMEALSPVGINVAPTSFAPTFPIRAPVPTSAVGEVHIHILSPCLPL